MNVLSAVLLTAWVVYLVCGAALKSGFHQPWVNVCWYLSKWPALGGVIHVLTYSIIVEHRAPTPLEWACFLFALWVWWKGRNDGDDSDVKRLKRRATESVKDIGGRLVVVPEPA